MPGPIAAKPLRKHPPDRSAPIRTGCSDPDSCPFADSYPVRLTDADPSELTKAIERLLASHDDAPLRELLALAIDNDRRWAHERRRQERRALLESLLPRLADALDVRKVFLDLSPSLKPIVDHDIVAFALLSPDRGGVQVQAATDGRMVELPEYRFSGPDEALDNDWQFLLAYELTPLADGRVRVRTSPRDVSPAIEIMVEPGAAWTRFATAAGVRSTLRVPIRAKDRRIGGVAFLSRRADAYDEEDAWLALRIADHVALAIAHRELVAEQRRIDEAEAHARQLEARVDELSRELGTTSLHRALGHSAQWKKVLADAAQVAATDATVLVTGESGSGKEVVARYLHRGSPRAQGPFVAINCAALPEQLLESELFGHERGAFTGALQSRAGKIEQAAGGVLFLDEIGEMSPAVQAKLLRVLQEREFQRVGGEKTLRADIRVIAATNRDPRQGMQAGTFREDLYYRLSVFELRLPPLRERTGDILVLAEAFLAELGRNVGRPAAGISEDARELLLAHPWPGNVRELRNAIERAVILCNGGLVTREHLPMTLTPIATPTPVATRREAAPAQSLGEVERELLEQAMATAHNNKSQAAKLLGLTRGQLYSLLRRHGLTDARR
ncbi:MAG TPA: sigma 54-interacting transcriptional regulator [Nannocystaceae bacterium]|nr:sigma 54-interacting transcriptional regulator [Nannocystaceae bacterium]